MTSYEQWEQLMFLAREYKLDVDDDPFYGIRIGKKRFSHHLTASIALLIAFDKCGIPVPPHLKERPTDLN